MNYKFDEILFSGFERRCIDTIKSEAMDWEIEQTGKETVLVYPMQPVSVEYYKNVLEHQQLLTIFSLETLMMGERYNM